MRFEFKPYDGIQAANKPEEKKDPQEIIDEKLDALKDDFEYAVAGIDKLCREVEYEQAYDIIDNISSVINAAIAEIGDNFTNNTEV